MTQEYTPTDQQVIDDYMPDDEDIGFDARTMPIGVWKRLKIAAFNRWRADHDSLIRAEAWDEGFTEGRDLAVSGRPMSRNNPYKEQKQ
jgi:hypothetical protein